MTVRKLGAGTVVEFAGNPGLRFHEARASKLADEVATLITRLAPPRLEVKGPRRLHVGMFRQPGKLLLHIHNFIPFSGRCAMPNPEVTPPEVAEKVRISLRGLCVSSARSALSGQEFHLAAKGDVAAFTIPEIGWGEVVELQL